MSIKILKRFKFKKLTLTFVAIIGLIINIVSLPYIMKAAPSNWKSVGYNHSEEITNEFLRKKSKLTTRLHAMFLVLGKNQPSSTIYISNENINPNSLFMDKDEFFSGMYSLGGAKKIETTEFNPSPILKEFSDQRLEPSSSGKMYTRLLGTKKYRPSIQWSIYTDTKGSNKKFLFISKNNERVWLLIDKDLISRQNLLKSCYDC